MFFRKPPPPIYEQIDEYCGWKSERYPLVAGAHRSLLRRFAQNYNIQSIEDIDQDEMAFFIGEELTQYYSEEARKALKAFLTYGRMAGYRCLSHAMATKENLAKPVMGRPVQWNMVREVQELKAQGYSQPRMIRELTQRHKRQIAKSSVERWLKRIPDLAGEGTSHSRA